MTSPRKVLDLFWSAVFPRVCAFCEKEEAGPKESFICLKCRSLPKAVQRVRPPYCKVCGMEYDGAITVDFACSNCMDLDLEFDSAQAAAHFKGLVRETVHRFKYQGHEWFEPFLAELLIEAAMPELKFAPADVVTPIPLHPNKKRLRGFNQAERLAERLAKAVDLPHDPGMLARVRETEPQALLERTERQKNMKGAFQYAGKVNLRGQRVILIDDVLTTGVTASACARELKRNGAGEVRVWTVARGGLT